MLLDPILSCFFSTCSKAFEKRKKILEEVDERLGKELDIQNILSRLRMAENVVRGSLSEK